ncbi:IS66 family insertion sequence element accessory protein TnpA [Alkaliphilus metalliredigens]|uniref:IS66 family insertion sequence element accessory protein TnpA n=1 Tax=Alkaliphilus metalliredigens TaxID=208226 RepID=UPI0005A0FD74|nr:hypothetical protein [Alkaliphilus metalliredigens]
MNREEKTTMWLERIESYKSRQGSATDWCEENNISLSTLRYWMTKFSRENKQSSNLNKWLPIEVTSLPKNSQHESNSSGVRIHIGLASIEISSDFDPKTLETVVGILSEKC